MRKSFYLMVVAALTWTGCSQNEIMDTNPDAHRAIGFGVYTGTQTRGVVTDNSTTNGGTANGLKVADKGFGMQAYLTSGAYQTNGLKGHFMDNVHVTWNASGSAWTYSPVKFWPENTTDKVSFFAYAPYTDTSNTTATGISFLPASNASDPVLGFKLQTAQQNMVDLVVSESNSGNNGTIDQTQTTTAGSSVNINFKHVLTRVAMKAKTSTDISASDNLTKVIITGVSIEHTEKLSNSALLNMKTLEWTSNQFLANSYALEKYSDNAKKGIMNYASFAFGNARHSDAIDISTSSTGVSLFPDNQYLFLIPVNNASGTTNKGDVSVKISYMIITKASDDNDSVSTSENTKTVELPAGIFKRGSAYELIFTISLNAIKLDVTDVESWTSTPTDVTVQ